MSKEIINQLEFKRKANKHHVKMRSPLRYVNEHEMDFKYSFGEMLGKMSEEFLMLGAKQLKI